MSMGSVSPAHSFNPATRLVLETVSCVFLDPSFMRGKRFDAVRRDTVRAIGGYMAENTGFAARPADSDRLRQVCGAKPEMDGGRVGGEIAASGPHFSNLLSASCAHRRFCAD